MQCRQPLQQAQLRPACLPSCLPLLQAQVQAGDLGQQQAVPPPAPTTGLQLCPTLLQVQAGALGQQQRVGWVEGVDASGRPGGLHVGWGWEGGGWRWVEVGRG